MTPNLTLKARIRQWLLVDEWQKRRLTWLWITVLVIALDMLTKQLANNLLDYAQSVPVLPVFDLTLLYNRGAAFSFLADHSGWQRWFFTVIALGVSIALTIWLMTLKAGERWLAIALTLILGGAIGNLIDRVYYGYVIDFIHVHWDGSYFPAFNIADSAISVGAVMVIIDALFFQEADKQEVDKQEADKPSEKSKS